MSYSMFFDLFIKRLDFFFPDKPKDVENFTCLSKNFQSLNCTWNPPENPVKVTYTLTYVVPGYLESRYASFALWGRNVSLLSVNEVNEVLWGE